MPDLVKALRKLADEIEQEEKGETSQKDRERLEALEKRIEESSTRREREEAFEELTDEEEEIVRRALDDHRTGRARPPATDTEDPPKDPPKAKRTRPGMRRGMAYTVDPDTGRKLDHAFVYGGEDEPDTVELEDEEDAA